MKQASSKTIRRTVRRRAPKARMVAISRRRSSIALYRATNRYSNTTSTTACSTNRKTSSATLRRLKMVKSTALGKTACVSGVTLNSRCRWGRSDNRQGCQRTGEPTAPEVFPGDERETHGRLPGDASPSWGWITEWREDLSVRQCHPGAAGDRGRRETHRPGPGLIRPG